VIVIRRFGRLAHGAAALAVLTILVAALGGVLGSSPALAGTDDYPAQWRNAPMDSIIDSWGEYNRECTSFVAWRLHSRNGFEMPFHDNATGWGPDAVRRGFAVNMSPAVGAVAWWSSGHVAWVEAVNNNSVTIEEYNRDFTGHYSERSVAANSVTGYIHFKDIAASADLFFIKTRNTGSGRVEVHSATVASGYQNGQHSVTWLGTGDQNNGYFQMVGQDLFFIKTRNTGSGRVEVHSATVASGYQNGQHSVTRFGTGDQNNGWFQIEDVDGDGRPDLAFIKTHNTGSGRVEVHWRTAASGFQSGIDVATALSEGDANNGWFQMVGQNLFFIKTRNTGSGRVEVHSRTIASAYKTGIDIATWFGTGDQSNGWFQMVGQNLFFTKTRNTGSGRIEVHSATAASGYTNGQHNVTWLGNGDQNNGWFQVAAK